MSSDDANGGVLSCRRPGVVVLLAVAGWMLPGGGSGLAHGGTPGGDGEVLYVGEAPRADLDWSRVLMEELPEIGDARAGRWPLVLWNGPDARELDVEEIAALLRRGIVPSIRLDPGHLKAARRISAAGAPVIYLQGRGGHWPYDLVGREPGDAVDPGRLEGWRIASEAFREDLMRLRDAGVTLDAAWLDYENAPLSLRLRDVRRADSTVPDVVLDDAGRFRVFRRQLWQSLVSSYFAAPLREVFPRAAVTNWIVSASRPDFPLLDWNNQPHPRTDIGLFTATNPIAYAIDAAFLANLPNGPLVSGEQVDRIYTHILLRQVSADAHARRLDAPHMQSMVWVGRWVRDHADRETPVMSRSAYREALRHIWLRGIDGMMVFNPLRKGYEEMAVREVLDAAEVYREMAPEFGYLASGKVMNFAVPDPHRAGVFWSGVETPSLVLLRTTNPYRDPVNLRVRLGSGTMFELEAPPGGATHKLEVSAPRRVGGGHQAVPGGSDSR